MKRKNTIKITSITIAILLMISISIMSVNAQNDNYPKKNITVIIPYPAGGGTDTITRIIDKYIEDELGARFNFVYKTGAGGAIGATEVARALNDGYTIGGVNIPHIVLQSITGTGDFDLNDFDYICQMADTSLIFVTPKGSKYTDLKSFIKAAKENPGKLTVGCPGALGDSSIAAWMFLEAANIEFTPVYYKGGAELLSAILGKHVDAAFSAINMTIPEKESMNLLAISTSTNERSKDLPEVLTFKELGYDVESFAARVYIAPDGLDPDIYNKLLEGFKGVYDNPLYQKDIQKAKFNSNWMPGSDLEKFVKDYNEKAVFLIDKYYQK